MSSTSNYTEAEYPLIVLQDGRVHPFYTAAELSQSTKTGDFFSRLSNAEASYCNVELHALAEIATSSLPTKAVETVKKCVAHSLTTAAQRSDSFPPLTPYSVFGTKEDFEEIKRHIEASPWLSTADDAKSYRIRHEINSACESFTA